MRLSYATSDAYDALLGTTTTTTTTTTVVTIVTTTYNYRTNYSLWQSRKGP